jgi:hypothetical protein
MSGKIITKELFEEAITLEDALYALIEEYYDTHDLSSIEENEDEYKIRLRELRCIFGLKKDEYFCNFTFDDFKDN